MGEDMYERHVNGEVEAAQGRVNQLEAEIARLQSILEEEAQSLLAEALQNQARYKADPFGYRLQRLFTTN